jgi:hypothetical protein
LVIGIFLCSGELWSDALTPLIYDSSGNYKPDKYFIGLSRELSGVQSFLGGGAILGARLYGTLFVIVGVGGLAYTYARANLKSPALRSRARGVSGLSMATMANLIIVLSSIEFFFIPTGDSIRPMGWAFYVVLIALGSFLILVPLGILCIFNEKPRFLGVLIVLFGISTVFIGPLLLNLAAWIKGFDLAD